jgi:hypothetical protein
MMMMMIIIIILIRTLQTHYTVFNLKSVDSRLSLFTAPKITYKTLNGRPNNNKNIITVVSAAVVCVVMNIIIKVRRGSSVHSARRLKLPRCP